MKFKDKKSGEVFHNIENVQTAYCERIHADCTSCPLSITNNPKIMYCYSFVANLVNYVRFEPSASDCPDNFGHYYTDYNPRTREGQGILGTIDKPLYMFKFRLVFAPEYNRKVLIK